MARNSLLRNFSQRMGEQGEKGTPDKGETSNSATTTGSLLGQNEALKGDIEISVSIFKRHVGN